MLYNRLFVVPTQETMSYLASVLSGSAVDVNLDDFKVEIITTQDALEIDPTRVYTAQAINVNTFYDSGLQQSNLYCAFASADLQQRARELNQEGVVRAFFDWYIPYMVIKKGMPALSQHVRSWRVSLANALCTNERPMQFTGEYVVQEDLQYIPDAEYIDAMAAELQYRHNA
jgi:hypothetical protein